MQTSHGSKLSNFRQSLIILCNANFQCCPFYNLDRLIGQILAKKDGACFRQSYVSSAVNILGTETRLPKFC